MPVISNPIGIYISYHIQYKLKKRVRRQRRTPQIGVLVTHIMVNTT